MTLTINNLNEIESAAQKFLSHVPEHRLFAFYGSMGAGKTTFIKSLCKYLGSGDTVTSPTFTLVNEYSTSNGIALYHFDFYRIKREEEVLDFGIYDYFDSGNYCFMEWPELIEDLLPEETLKVVITVNPDNSRTIEIKDSLV